MEPLTVLVSEGSNSLGETLGQSWDVAPVSLDWAFSSTRLIEYGCGGCHAHEIARAREVSFSLPTV